MTGDQLRQSHFAAGYDAAYSRLDQENQKLREKLERGQQEWQGWDELAASLQYKLHELQKENAQLREKLERGEQEWEYWDEGQKAYEYKIRELQEENAKLKQDIEIWARKYADSSTAPTEEIGQLRAVARAAIAFKHADNGTEMGNASVHLAQAISALTYSVRADNYLSAAAAAADARNWAALHAIAKIAREALGSR